MVLASCLCFFNLQDVKEPTTSSLTTASDSPRSLCLLQQMDFPFHTVDQSKTVLPDVLPSSCSLATITLPLRGGVTAGLHVKCPSVEQCGAAASGSPRVLSVDHELGLRRSPCQQTQTGKSVLVKFQDTRSWNRGGPRVFRQRIWLRLPVL